MIRLLPSRLSISTRLTIWYGLTLMVLLSLFAFTAYLFFRQGLHEDFDRHLAHERHMLTPFVRIVDGRPAFTSLDDLRSVAYQTDGIYGTYVRLLSPDGEVLYQSPNLQDHDEMSVLLPERPAEVSVSRTWENEPMRSHYVPLSGEQGGVAGYLEVSGFEWSVHQELDRLGQALAVGILLSVLLAMGGGQLLARRALRPVSTLTEAARQIQASNLGTRLPSRFGVHDELTVLAETFNEMIDRLDASFQRERRFTSNAAHELLTPLTTIRNGMEIVLRRDRAPEVYREKIRTTLVDVDEMIAKVRGLLQLARVERMGETPHEPVDLSAVVRRHVDRLHERAAAKDVTLDAALDGPVLVRADAVRLGEIVDNLIDNALKYTPSGGRIAVEIHAEGEQAVLAVSDTGVGFTPEEATQLFDRFYRADKPEVQAHAGSGLGLSIVRAIVELYGGTLSAASEGPGRGSRFEVRLPLLQPGRRRHESASTVLEAALSRV